MLCTLPTNWILLGQTGPPWFRRGQWLGAVRAGATWRRWKGFQFILNKANSLNNSNDVFRLNASVKGICGWILNTATECSLVVLVQPYNREFDKSPGEKPKNLVGKIDRRYCTTNYLHAHYKKLSFGKNAVQSLSPCSIFALFIQYCPPPALKIFEEKLRTSQSQQVRKRYA